MDRFKVSGEELRQHYDESTELSKVFGDIEIELKATNQVVCQFIVNGIALQEDDELKFSVVPLKEVISLEYLAENTSQLIVGVMDGWIDAIPELIKSSENLSRKIRNEGIANKARDIRDLIENCQFLINSIISLKSVLGDSVLGSIDKWPQAEQWTQKTLKEALTAFEKKDFVLLADVVDYDLNHGLQLWLGILESVKSVYTGKSITASAKNGAHSLDRRPLSN